MEAHITMVRDLVVILLEIGFPFITIFLKLLDELLHGKMGYLRKS